ncbi:uncharacterized protein LOC103482309 isoform X3 [Poecilia reticulata]|uniref:uncharacterized protein LOC103482309 isoform X3 n=1 Tax=Poecilia reticulata TaxID=8081 RepID=UPI0007E9ADB5|nr:PREDICTED: uncharacterized protein LOC103482309 isoform X3 [Poecilia reticulata]
MSTSDAAELELRVAGVGGETTTPQCATARTAWTPTASEQQDNTSADSLGKDKAYHWGHSEVKIQNAAGSILVTSLIFRLSKPKLGLEKTLEAWSSARRVNEENMRCKVGEHLTLGKLFREEQGSEECRQSG